MGPSEGCHELSLENPVTFLNAYKIRATREHTSFYYFAIYFSDARVSAIYELLWPTEKFFLCVVPSNFFAGMNQARCIKSYVCVSTPELRAS